MNFVHLNVHGKASMLYGSADISELIQRTKKIGQSAIALTDYSNIFNAINFYREASAAGIKPIVGVDLCFCEDAAQYKEQHMRSFSRIVLLAENDIGFKNIARLVSISNSEEYYYYNPRVDFGLLERYKEGVICLSGSSLDGIIASNLLDKLNDNGEISERAPIFKARGLVRRLLKIFDNDHLFLEVQNNGIPSQAIINSRLRNIAKEYNLRTVATNNVHYVERHDAEAHKTLLAMGSSQYVRVTNTSFVTDEFYLKSREELEKEEFTQEELSITEEIASRCNITIDFKKRRLPKYQFVPEGISSIEYLKQIANDGLKILELDPQAGDDFETYQHRLDRELSDIADMGFADYFLIVYDVISWIRSQGIIIGRGRGSAGGSLVSYALGITEINPMQYGLIWERFLNKGRGGLPDIDSDVPRSQRQKVLAYIRERFGISNVAQLVTLSGLQARAVLKEVFRVYNMDFDEANKITSLVPTKNDEHIPISLEEAIATTPALKEYYDKYTAWFKIALSLEGCYKSTGIHASAVVISDTAIEDSFYPMTRAKNNDLLFGWDMNTIDSLGLLKLDILGLTTLDDIQSTRTLVKERRGIDLSRKTMPLDDPATWTMLSQGYTVGVFQIEKQLGKTWAKNLQPENIEQLSDLISIIRPGPMDSNMHTAYRGVKNKSETPQYIHSKLEPIMKNTFSALLYQEQVIEICKKLANMSLVDADNVRKAMGKKKPEEMKKWKEIFINGCTTNDIDIVTAEEIWGYIEKFAGYGFNKCIFGKAFVIRAGANQHQGREITLAELWRYYHGDLKRTSTGKKYRNKKHPNLGLRIMAMKDGRIKPDRIADVIQTGIKTTYEMKLSTGESIRSTLDHKFWTDNGWQRLQDIKIGDVIYVSGSYEQTTIERSRKLSRFSDVTIENRKFKSAIPFTFGEGNSSYVDGAYIAFQSERERRISEIAHCEQCHKTSKRYELAHLDGDHTNQDPVNLMLMCVSCHKKYDYQNNDRNARFDKGYPIESSVVVAIDDPQDEMTYDIEMCGEEHNYIANGIVTHNSHGVGYALLAYETAYLKANYTVEFICAKLRHSDSHPDKFEQMSALTYDAKLFNIEVVPPRMIQGNKDFDIVDDTHIAFGLTALKGVGVAAIGDLVKIGKECKTFDEILWRIMTTKTKISIAVITALIRGGAFDDIEDHRIEAQARLKLIEVLTPNELELVQKLKIHQEGPQDWIRIVRAIADENKALVIKTRYNVKIPDARRRPKLREALQEFDIRELFDTKAQRIAWEQFYLGISLSGSEADIYNARDKCIDLVRTGGPDSNFEIAVCVDNVHEVVCKKGQLVGQSMAFVTARDNTYVMDNIVVFPKIFNATKGLIDEGSVLKIQGRIDGRGSLVANKIERLK